MSRTTKSRKLNHKTQTQQQCTIRSFFIFLGWFLREKRENKGSPRGERTALKARLSVIELPGMHHRSPRNGRLDGCGGVRAVWCTPPPPLNMTCRASREMCVNYQIHTAAVTGMYIFTYIGLFEKRNSSTIIFVLLFCLGQYYYSV